MPDIDPQIFSISRPSLGGYKAFVQRDMIVETYRSAAGQMVSRGSLHRISINRTAHGKYAYRLGSGAFRKVRLVPDGFRHGAIGCKFGCIRLDHR
ncbi:hypothetical protein ACCT30_36540, partial [Rhizobium ruizarguesonis]